MTTNLAGPHIEGLKAYPSDRPLDQLRAEFGLEEILQLSNNESLLGPSPKAVEAMRRSLEKIQHYPVGGGGGPMHRAIADFHGISADRVITANGSNEVLTLTVRTFCDSGVHNAVTFDYGFLVYDLICRSHNVEVRSVPMGEGFAFDLEAMAGAIDESTRLVFVANPNNPTGTYVDAGAMRAFLEHVPEQVIVVVDEAYAEYVRAADYESALAMGEIRERLIVLRTFSKCYGLAGVRSGYGVAPAPIVDRMNRVRAPFTCNAMAQAAVPAALADQEHVRRAVSVNDEGRAVMEAGLERLAGQAVEWTPSQTNFLLVKVPLDARQVADSLRQRGVLVRPMTGYGLPQSLRISLTSGQKMQRCLDALRSVLEQG
ncbi:MAG: histidinol-phosphate transaminase [Bradymonadaceae bacterium]